MCSTVLGNIGAIGVKSAVYAVMFFFLKVFSLKPVAGGLMLIKRIDQGLEVLGVFLLLSLCVWVVWLGMVSLLMGGEDERCWNGTNRVLCERNALMGGDEPAYDYKWLYEVMGRGELREPMACNEMALPWPCEFVPGAYVRKGVK